MASYSFGSSSVSDMKKRKDQLWLFVALCVCGIKWKCEGPFQARKIERALISASGQGFNSIEFWSKTHNWACWWLKELSAFFMKQK